jgi:hypothetical protein
MSTLTIRKKSLKTWLHTDSILGDFIISKFYFNADNVFFQIVEQGQSRRIIYNIFDITLYALPTGGTAETFSSITALSLRLEQLNYPAFQYDGQITSIANLIDAGTGVTITGDGTEASPYVINSTGGSGGTQTLAEVLVEGNTTGGTDILLNNDDAIQLENNSSIRKGTYDYGQGGGVSRICGVDYEDMWQGGIRHVFDNNGFIRNSTNGFNSPPNFSFDASLRFKVGSFWTLDDGTTYICTDATVGAAVWEIYSVGATPTLQQVLDNNHDLVDGNNFQGTNAGFDNTGINVISLGEASAYINSGDDINALGFQASYNNTGNDVNSLGNSAALSNSGNDVNALGFEAGVDNLGIGNTFNNVNLFGASATADEDGQTVLSKDGAIMARISTTDLTATRKYNLPDADGTLALTSDLTAPTLQEVTDQGAVTSNPIKVIDTGNSSAQLQQNGIYFEDLDDLGNTFLRFDNTSVANQEVLVRGLSGTMALLSDIPSGGVTSVGLTMPSAFSVTNSPITSSGDIAVTGAGLVSQYVRGDGTLANFPTSTGGGSSVNYYLNGSVSQGTFGGTTYYEMSKTPILGAGTNFTRTNGQGNGYIASFITDAGDPSFLNIPAGNWTLEFYFQSSSTGGSPQFYGEIYKVSATDVFTLVASGSANPEGITNGTTVDQYFTSISVPQTSLLITDRLAVRIYVITSGRTITLHTENGNLSEVLTTFTTGLTALNGLITQVQNLAVGTSGTDFAISSATDTHTFNLPTASASNRGALSSTDWSTFNNKQNALSYTPYRNVQTSQTALTGTTAETVMFTATIPAGAFSSNDVIKVLFGANKTLGLGTYSLRIRVNTTNTIAGAPTIALYSGTLTAQVNIMMRNFSLNGGNLYGIGGGNSAITDIVALGSTLGSTTLNPANQFFLFATITLNNSGDSIIGNMFSIHN